MKGLENIMIPSTIKWHQSDVDFYLTSHIGELNQHFVNYINFGGYRKLFSLKKSRPIQVDILSKIY